MSVLYNNVTIMLQGILHDEVDLVNTLTLYTKLCNVVLSIYVFNADSVMAMCSSFNNVSIVLNDLSEYERDQVTVDEAFKHCDINALHKGYFQICTTKKGLDAVTSEYVIKSRVDHYYEGIEEMIKCCINTDKIVISSVYVRGCHDRNADHTSRCCFSDCLFMGKTEKLQLCFVLCYNKKLLTRPETGQWTPYFEYVFEQMGLDVQSIDDETYLQIMLQLVEIMCINSLGSYRLKICNRIETYLYDTNKSTKEYLLYGCDC